MFPLPPRPSSTVTGRKPSSLIIVDGDDDECNIDSGSPTHTDGRYKRKRRT